jgi:Holliday junction resolvase RusA-like endonuclease
MEEMLMAPGQYGWPDYRAWEYSATVLGELASKNNSRRAVFRGSKPRFIKSAKALGFRDMFLAQVRKPARPYEGYVSLTAVCYYASWRPDLDITLLQDCIQEAGIIKNDRQIVEQHIFRGIDRVQARIEFEICSISPESKKYY